MIDLALTALIVFSFIMGWRAGLLKSIFSLLGFVGGGLAGLILAIKFLSHISNVFGKFALYILFISIGSTIGEWILGRFAKFFHSKVLFAPFSWIDSIFGSLFIIIRNGLIVYLIFSLITVTGWKTPSKYINQSKIYENSKKFVPQVFKKITAQIKY